MLNHSRFSYPNEMTGKMLAQPPVLRISCRTKRLKYIVFTFALASLLPAFADGEDFIPKSISCDNGSVKIRRVGPLASVNTNTTVASYTLTFNGKTEPATGYFEGNNRRVEGTHYRIFSGTGGLTFAESGDNGKLICSNSKYGNTTPGFKVTW